MQLHKFIDDFLMVIHSESFMIYASYSSELFEVQSLRLRFPNCFQ